MREQPQIEERITLGVLPGGPDRARDSPISEKIVANKSRSKAQHMKSYIN